MAKRNAAAEPEGNETKGTQETEDSITNTKTDTSAEAEKILAAARAQAAEIVAAAQKEAAAVKDAVQKEAAAVKDAVQKETAAVKDAVQKETADDRPAVPPGEELVPVRLFKDNDRYKDDVFVAVNGERVQIKRGETVMVKRKFADVLEQSMAQDMATANLIEQESSKYDAEAKARGL